MDMKQSNYTWHGCDVNNEISLFEYGVLVKKIRKGTYACIILVSDNGLDGRVFERQVFDYDEWVKALREGKGTDAYPSMQKLANLSGWDVDEYDSWLGDESMVASFLGDLISYYGISEIFPYHSKGYTETEIRRILNKALR